MTDDRMALPELVEKRAGGDVVRDRDSRAGRIVLEIPKLRKGSCFPSFPQPRRTAEKALVAPRHRSRTM